VRRERAALKKVAERPELVPIFATGLHCSNRCCKARLGADGAPFYSPPCSHALCGACASSLDKCIVCHDDLYIGKMRRFDLGAPMGEAAEVRDLCWVCAVEHEVLGRDTKDRPEAAYAGLCERHGSVAVKDRVRPRDFIRGIFARAAARDYGKVAGKYVESLMRAIGNYKGMQLPQIATILSAWNKAPGRGEKKIDTMARAFAVAFPHGLGPAVAMELVSRQCRGAVTADTLHKHAPFVHAVSVATVYKQPLFMWLKSRRYALNKEVLALGPQLPPRFGDGALVSYDEDKWRDMLKPALAGV
jgi:hypothetical protein